MSATPWSLLTKTSRFPTERIGQNTQTGKIEFIHEKILKKWIFFTHLTMYKPFQYDDVKSQITIACNKIRPLSWQTF